MLSVDQGVLCFEPSALSVAGFYTVILEDYHNLMLQYQTLSQTSEETALEFVRARKAKVREVLLHAEVVESWMRKENSRKLRERRRVFEDQLLQ